MYTQHTHVHVTGVLSTAAGVTRDQAEADEDMSIQQRLILAGGSTLEGTSEMVDNDILADALEVTGELAVIFGGNSNDLNSRVDHE